MRPGTAVSAIRRVREKEVTAIIITKIVQELLYRFQSIQNLAAGLALAREAMGMCARILPVTEADLSLALRILEAQPQIRTRDAFHSATMINNGIKEILTTDAQFDLISEIRRIPPG